jgi:Glyoxalase/Bleomycin resistance protein/Dioxygenase superfamily
VITAVHGLVYSREPEAFRAFLRDILGWSHVDAGNGAGWLVFALPPAEVGVHPTDGPSMHELYLMCTDLEATVAELTAKGVEFTEPVTDAGFGLVTRLRVTGDETLMLYQPKHPSPLDVFRPADGG